MKAILKSLIAESRHLLIIFLSLAFIMITSALVELNQSKKELLMLMNNQSHALLESISTASRNLLYTSSLFQESYNERLLNTADIIRNLFVDGVINNARLNAIASRNEHLAITIYNEQGMPIMSSSTMDTSVADDPAIRSDLNKFRMQNDLDTLIIGLKPEGTSGEFSYAVAVAGRNRNIIYVRSGASPLIEARKRSGFGVLLRTIVQDNPQLVYACLQDTNAILAASGNVRELEPLLSSPFLESALTADRFNTRQAGFDSIRVFEAVIPFNFENSSIGLFRVGLSLEPLQEINRRIYRRIALISFILLVMGSLIFAYIFARQRFEITRQRLDLVETYSGNIIENVSDAIIVFNSKSGIQVFNRSSEKIFTVSFQDMEGKNIDYLLEKYNCHHLLKQKTGIEQMECRINGTLRFLLVSKTGFKDENGLENSILVLRDLTEIHLLEDQLNRKERITAMGELAAGVAHEIRNPLNSISTIIQQLDRDFEPVSDSDDYHELAQIVVSEVKRIDRTVQNFLQFTSPSSLNLQAFYLRDLLHQIEVQFSRLLTQSDITLSIKTDWDGRVTWDLEKMKQVFVNLIKNAIDAMDSRENAAISIQTRKTTAEAIEIVVADSGPGIPEDIIKRIFNLYFTTKSSGTGIGLSIVQKIIDMHGGTIQVHSEKNNGTRFTITLPVNS